MLRHNIKSSILQGTPRRAVSPRNRRLIPSHGGRRGLREAQGAARRRRAGRLLATPPAEAARGRRRHGDGAVAPRPLRQRAARRLHGAAFAVVRGRRRRAAALAVADVEPAQPDASARRLARQQRAAALAAAGEAAAPDVVVRVPGGLAPPPGLGVLFGRAGGLRRVVRDRRLHHLPRLDAARLWRHARRPRVRAVEGGGRRERAVPSAGAGRRDGGAGARRAGALRGLPPTLLRRRPLRHRRALGVAARGAGAEQHEVCHRRQAPRRQVRAPAVCEHGSGV